MSHYLTSKSSYRPITNLLQMIAPFESTGHQGSHLPLKLAFNDVSDITRIVCIAYIQPHNLPYLTLSISSISFEFNTYSYASSFIKAIAINPFLNTFIFPHIAY